MREIKFRGKHIHSLDINKKLDGIWVYGYLCSENYIWSDELCGDMLVDKNTIGQYTGLKDKNGVEIYEGDIVKQYYDIGIVKYGAFNCSCCEGVYGYYIESKGYSYPDIRDLSNNTEIEVIGNIYDNKELLKKEGK